MAACYMSKSAQLLASANYLISIAKIKCRHFCEFSRLSSVICKLKLLEKIILTVIYTWNTNIEWVWLFCKVCITRLLVLIILCQNKISFACLTISEKPKQFKKLLNKVALSVLSRLGELAKKTNELCLPLIFSYFLVHCWLTNDFEVT